VNYAAKRTTLVLFINGRLVDSSSLRRALEAAYTTVMPKAAKPWVYLDIRLPLDHVDVNVHPTKKEVRFLHEEELIDALREAVEARLVASNSTRTFVQKKLSGGEGGPFASEQKTRGVGEAAEGGAVAAPEKKTYYQPQKLVRTDAKATRIEAFMMPSKAPSAAGAKRGAEEAGLDGSGALIQPQTQASRQRVHENDNACELSSVKEVLEGFSRQGHSQLAEVLRQHTYIGVADERRIMLQHQTKLYLLDVTVLSRDMFFQQVFRRFGGFDCLRLSEPASLEELALLGLEHGGSEELGTQFDAAKGTEAARELAEALQTKAAMLEEYFGVSIDGEGRLCTLPQLIDGYVPELERLPAFVLGLGGVDWGEERPCFEGVAAELASLYEMRPAVPPGPEDPEGPGRAEQEARAEVMEQAMQNVLLPAMRLFLQPPMARATDGSTLLVTTLERLYRVFERC
jgi:DNA mismatch repair protein MLH1